MEPWSGNRTVLNLFGQRFQLGRYARPIVERGLQRRGDMIGCGIPGEIARDDNELSVTAMFQGSKLHIASMPPIRRRSKHRGCFVGLAAT
jgi:hypothetical protein